MPAHLPAQVYIQDDAYYFWPPPSAQSERWNGFNEFVRKSCHYDGGFETEELSSMLPSYYSMAGGGGVLFPVAISGSDDPGAVTNVTLDDCTMVDYGAVLWGIAWGIQIWPPGTDTVRQQNVHMVDAVMDDVRGLDPGDVFDGAYFSPPGGSSILVERTRFLDSGIFEASALGM